MPCQDLTILTKRETKQKQKNRKRKKLSGLRFGTFALYRETACLLFVFLVYVSAEISVFLELKRLPLRLLRVWLC